MANEEAKLFVAGLPDSVSEEVLKQLFEATGGTVVNVSLPKDRATGRPRGFGFVTLSTPAEAQAARDALDGSMQAGKSISVRPFQAEPPRGRSRRPQAAARGALARTVLRARSRATADGAEAQAVRVHPIARSTSGTSRTTARNRRSRRSSTASPAVRWFAFTCRWTPTAESAASASSPCRARRAPRRRPRRLKQADMRGRRLIINLAHPKGERPARPDGGFGGGGGGGGFPSQRGRRVRRAPSGRVRRSAPPQRKTFDDRRRRHTNNNEDGPRKRRFEKGDGDAKGDQGRRLDAGRRIADE